MVDPTSRRSRSMTDRRRRAHPFVRPGASFRPDPARRWAAARSGCQDRPLFCGRRRLGLDRREHGGRLEGVGLQRCCSVNGSTCRRSACSTRLLSSHRRPALLVSSRSSSAPWDRYPNGPRPAACCRGLDRKKGRVGGARARGLYRPRGRARPRPLQAAGRPKEQSSMPVGWWVQEESAPETAELDTLSG